MDIDLQDLWERMEKPYIPTREEMQALKDWKEYVEEAEYSACLDDPELWGYEL